MDIVGSSALTITKANEIIMAARAHWLADDPVEDTADEQTEEAAAETEPDEVEAEPKPTKESAET